MKLALPPRPLPQPPAAVPEHLRLGSNDVHSAGQGNQPLFPPGLQNLPTIEPDKASRDHAANAAVTRQRKLDRQRRRSNEPKHLLKCRFGCRSRAGPFRNRLHLRKHMMAVHHLFRMPHAVDAQSVAPANFHAADKLRDKLRACGCGRIFASELELQRHCEPRMDHSPRFYRLKD